MKKTILGIIYDTDKDEYLHGNDRESIYLSGHGGFYLVRTVWQVLDGKQWRDSVDDDCDENGVFPDGLPLRHFDLIRPLSKTDVVEWSMKNLLPPEIADILPGVLAQKTA